MNHEDTAGDFFSKDLILEGGKLIMNQQDFDDLDEL